MGSKIAKIIKIIVEVEHLKNQGSLPGLEGLGHLLLYN